MALDDNAYYLYPAILRAHKGHDYLADALERAENHYPIVLCGLGTDFREDAHQLPCRAFIDSVAPRLKALAERGRIRSLGEVDAAAMAVLAKHARAYVLPSRYEGFVAATCRSD